VPHLLLNFRRRRRAVEEVRDGGEVGLLLKRLQKGELVFSSFLADLARERQGVLDNWIKGCLIHLST